MRHTPGSIRLGYFSVSPRSPRFYRPVTVEVECRGQALNTAAACEAGSDTFRRLPLADPECSREIMNLHMANGDVA
jgi:hypothetical protein